MSQDRQIDIERSQMIPGAKEELQRRLLELFEADGLNVGVGLTKEGVAIRSQCPEVDARNIGEVVARPADERDDPMLALLKAMSAVRQGKWIGGAPSHIGAELLAQLEADGWHLRRDW